MRISGEMGWTGKMRFRSAVVLPSFLSAALLSACGPEPVTGDQSEGSGGTSPNGEGGNDTGGNQGSSDGTGGQGTDDGGMGGAAATGGSTGAMPSEPSAWTECYPFDQPSPTELRASDKKIFAWYFPPYPLSIDNQPPANDYYARWLSPTGGNGEYIDTGGHLRDRPLYQRAPRPESNWRQLDFEVEVRQAIAAGLDGFILEMTWREQHNDGRWNQTQALLDAAAVVDPEFLILLAPGFPTEDGAGHDELRETIRSFAHHPSVYRLPDGRLPLSTFYPERPSQSGGKPLSWWSQLFADLSEHGIEVAWIPHFLSRTSRNELANLDAWHDLIAGYSIWDGKFVSQATFNASEQVYADERELLWFAHALLQDMRLRKGPNVELRHWESSGSATFRGFFEQAILADSRFVSIITWNDYGETQIAPSVARGHAVVDVLSYYTTWMKTGAPPPIVRDALYYFHRKQPVSAPFDETQQTAGAYVIPAGPAGQDSVELLAFLTAPGRLIIRQGEDAQALDAPSGLTSFVVPLVADATPRFQLERQGDVTIDLLSHASVASTVVYQDMTLQAGGSLECERP